MAPPTRLPPRSKPGAQLPSAPRNPAKPASTPTPAESTKTAFTPAILAPKQPNPFNPVAKAPARYANPSAAPKDAIKKENVPPGSKAAVRPAKLGPPPALKDAVKKENGLLGSKAPARQMNSTPALKETVKKENVPPGSKASARSMNSAPAVKDAVKRENVLPTNRKTLTPMNNPPRSLGDPAAIKRKLSAPPAATTTLPAPAAIHPNNSLGDSLSKTTVAEPTGFLRFKPESSEKVYTAATYDTNDSTTDMNPVEVSAVENGVPSHCRVKADTTSWVPGRKYATPTTAGAQSQAALASAVSNPISTAIFSAATDFGKKLEPSVVSFSQTPADPSIKLAPTVPEAKGKDVAPTPIFTSIATTPPEKRFKAASVSKRRSKVRTSEKTSKARSASSKTSLKADESKASVLPQILKDKLDEIPHPNDAGQASVPASSAQVATADVSTSSAPVMAVPNPKSTDVALATPSSKSAAPKTTAKSKSSSKKKVECNSPVLVFQASDTAVGLNMTFDHCTSLTMQEGRDWSKAMGELLRTDALFRTALDNALATKIAALIFDSKQLEKYLLGESFEFSVKIKEICLCPEPCGQASTAVAASNPVPETQPVKAEPVSDEPIKGSAESASEEPQPGWKDFTQFEIKITKMIAKCLEAELFTAPQDIRIEMMRSVNGASKSSSSSLTKLLDYVKTSSSLKSVCQKASSNPKYSTHEAGVIEVLLLKYATSLTEDEPESETGEEQSVDDEADDSIEYTTIVEDYFRSKNIDEEEQKMLWDFLDYWCYESVPEIIWDSDVKKRNRKNPFKRDRTKKNAISDEQRDAVYEAIALGNCRPVLVRSLDENAAGLAELLMDLALCTDPENQHHTCCYKPDEAQAQYRAKIEEYMENEKCRYIQQREILHMLGVFFDPKSFDRSHIKHVDYDSIEECVEARIAYTKGPYGITKPQYRLHRILCREAGMPSDINPTDPYDSEEECCMEAYRRSWRLACADIHLAAAINDIKKDMGIRVQYLNVYTSQFGDFVVLRCIDEEGLPTDGPDLIAIEQNKVKPKIRRPAIAHEEADDSKCVRPRNKTKGGTQATLDWGWGEVFDAMGMVDRSESGIQLKH